MSQAELSGHGIQNFILESVLHQFMN